MYAIHYRKVILTNPEKLAGQPMLLPGFFYRYSILLPMLLMVVFMQGWAQKLVLQDTARGSVGDEMSVTLTLRDTGSAIVLQGKLFLSNPTVFYPLRFKEDSLLRIDKQQLVRHTDSTYSFAINISPLEQGRTELVLKLWGEALAGSDSLCFLSFDSVYVGDSLLRPLRTTILTNSIGTRLPYVRFATLEAGYPNPTAPGLNTTWAYRIDKASTISFISYDVLGREIRRDVIENQSLGVHLYQFVPDLDFPVGVYTLRMKTNSGEALQRFVVVN